MNFESILPHHNSDSILFIGGPLDGQYQKVAAGLEYYIYKSNAHNEPIDTESIDQEESQQLITDNENPETQEIPENSHQTEVIYHRKGFSWKNNRTIFMMIMDGVPESYLKYLAKAIKDGVEENLPLPVVYMCLPSVEQFNALKN